MSRFIELAGCHNLRDLGGYAGLDGATVRTGAVYRCDALGRVADEDLRPALGTLGIRTTIDLRGAHERERQGRIADDVPGRHLHISATDRAANATAPVVAVSASRDIGELYLSMVRGGADAYARCIEVIADADGHAVAFFCSAGKDRTGVLAAMVLGLLGVPDDDIVADYAITELVADLIEARSISEDPHIVEAIWSKLPPGVSRAWPSSMERFLELVRAEHGGMDDLVRSLGVTDATIDALRGSLLV